MIRRPRIIIFLYTGHGGGGAACRRLPLVMMPGGGGVHPHLPRRARSSAALLARALPAFHGCRWRGTGGIGAWCRDDGGTVGRPACPTERQTCRSMAQFWRCAAAMLFCRLRAEGGRHAASLRMSHALWRKKCR